jgi:hypothetical protein
VDGYAITGKDPIHVRHQDFRPLSLGLSCLLGFADWRGIEADVISALSKALKGSAQDLWLCRKSDIGA